MFSGIVQGKGKVLKIRTKKDHLSYEISFPKGFNKNLKKGDYLQCFGCRRPLTKDDLESEFYKKGVSCHKCFHTSSDMDKERFAQRQLQIELAEKKGYTHMGANAKQSKR